MRSLGQPSDYVLTSYTTSLISQCRLNRIDSKILVNCFLFYCFTSVREAFNRAKVKRGVSDIFTDIIIAFLQYEKLFYDFLNRFNSYCSKLPSFFISLVSLVAKSPITSIARVSSPISDWSKDFGSLPLLQKLCNVHIDNLLSYIGVNFTNISPQPGTIKTYQL